MSSDSEKGMSTPSSPSIWSEEASMAPSSSGDSSRSVSSSYHQKFSPKPSIKFFTRRLPTRPVRYLSSFLILTILILIFSLLRMSFVSSRRLELGNLGKKPAPPAQWEEFPFLKRYYGGLRTLVKRADNVPEYPQAADEERSPPKVEVRNQSLPDSRAFNPYPDYASQSYLAEYAPVKDCLAGLETNRIPSVRAYDGVVGGFPDNVMGSYDLLGIRDDVCFERYGRLGPYGYGYSIKSGGSGAGLHGDREGIESVWGDAGETDFTKVKWAQLQAKCLQLNDGRFKKNELVAAGSSAQRFQKMDSTSGQTLHARDAPASGPQANSKEHAAPEQASATEASTDTQNPGKKLLPRTAFIIRTWWNYEYKEEDIMYLRALITELSLLSSGEYTVHFLVHVKDDNIQIWADDELYQRVLQDSIPEEFWGMATLWTERQMGLIYGGLKESFFRGLPVHGAYRSTFLPVQWFSQQHPEYDFFWHWEMDARYTGHYYHLLDRVSQWARKQPRKGIWERSSRFFVPEVDGSWEDFSQMVRVQTEKGTNDPNNIWSGINTGNPDSPAGERSKGDKPIWGPERPPAESDLLTSDLDVEPPTTYEKDKYEWGVGEDADLITFNPLFDPDGTTWLLADDVTGYNTTEKMPPRRAAIITTSRFSRRLLTTMHRETSLMRHIMFSEAWPASCALHHGFKAVHAPHPVYIDREWPIKYLAGVFNGGRNGASGGARTSVFGEREHNFRGTTWYYNAGFAPNLWRRWLGFRVDNNGGEEYEVANEGRMCLPGMLLHPVKDVRLVVEGATGSKEDKEKGKEKGKPS
ncbi:MAG: Anaphase-promoting complex subunit 23 [Chaenotheca gracillima]|nr:MAG: Anaphase-promoting complex subunit 23 [Chaenotheca gracillima]